MKTIYDKNDEFDYPYDEDDEMFAVASYTECTGLVQIPPPSDEAATSYNDIYSVPRVKNENKKAK